MQANGTELRKPFLNHLAGLSLNQNAMERVHRVYQQAPIFLAILKVVFLREVVATDKLKLVLSELLPFFFDEAGAWRPLLVFFLLSAGRFLGN